MRRTKAYLTVYLALTLAILLSLCMALIEGTRYNAVRLESACAVEVGLNSIFAEYHRELLEQYNMFAIDTSYGGAQPEIGKTQVHLADYLRKNLMDDRVDLLGWLCRDFLDMELEECVISSAAYLSDDNGAVFHRRAAEAVRDDLGLELFEEVKGWVQTMESNNLREQDIAAEKQRLDDELNEYDGTEKQISEKEWITIEVENPTDALDGKRREGILKWVVDEESVSGASVVTDNLISARMCAGMCSQGNLQLKQGSGMEETLENFFFHEYLLKYMGHYGQESEEDLLKYQIEYILMGKNSDTDNLRTMAENLCAIRWAADTIYLLGDEEKCAEAEILATVLAAAMLIPEATEVIKGILLLGWAFAESVYDVKTLFSGGRIPLLKSDETWHYGLENALGSGSDGNSKGSGLSYEDYLRMLLMIGDEDTQTLRAMDMVEADIRQTPGNGAFRLDGCVDCLEMSVRIKSSFGYETALTRQRGYYIE